MEQSQLWPDQRPEAWTACAEAFGAGADRFQGNFASNALDMVGLKPGERLLDVAAGTGSVAFEAARRGADVLATDFSPGMVEYMRARIAEDGLSNVKAELMDGQALGLPDNSFDVAASMFGLILFPDRAKGFRELYRILRSGGRAVVVAWGPPERIQVLASIMKAIQGVPGAGPPPWAGPPPAVSLQSPDVLRGEMEEAGFQRIEIDRVTHPMEADSAQAMWEQVTSALPMFTALSDVLGAEKMEAARRAFVQRVQLEYGEGPLGMDAEANIAVGAK
jgi:SAM-dependent methyltransferase